MAAPQVTVSTSVHASKTWTLPPRAKPGRKSKKELAAAAGIVEEPDQDVDYDKASRTKQKASRERKQEYIAELEAKLRAYEQGDGERASFFQNLAKKHSEENEALRAENESLKRKLAEYEGASPPSGSLTRKASTDLGRRAKRQRTRTDSISSSASSSTAIFRPSVPRAMSATSPSQYPSAHSAQASGSFSLQPELQLPPSPPVSTSAIPPAVLPPSAIPEEGCGFCDRSVPGSCLCEEMGFDPSKSSTPSLPSLQQAHCGFCSKAGNDVCVCAEAGLVQPPSATLPSLSPPKASCGICTGHSGSSCLCEDVGLGRPGYQSTTHTARVPSTAAVPLRLRKKGIPAGKVWRLDDQPAPPAPRVRAPPPPNNAAAAASVALRRRLIKAGSRLPCSGDPRNCLACADDPAGQAFCAALSSTVCSTNPCSTCPNRPSPLGKELRSEASHTPPPPSIRRKDSSARDEVPDAMVPCSDAWATLREHPNIGFANLELLANVVAKKTRCSGPERDANGKIIQVDREGLEEALDMLDLVRAA